MRGGSKLIIRVRLGNGDGLIVTVRGRDAWARRELIGAGRAGVTPLENPAPRWAGYIHNLRRTGFEIETVNEAHAGPFIMRDTCCIHR